MLDPISSLPPAIQAGFELGALLRQARFAPEPQRVISESAGVTLVTRSIPSLSRDPNPHFLVQLEVSNLVLSEALKAAPIFFSPKDLPGFVVPFAVATLTPPEVAGISRTAELRGLSPSLAAEPEIIFSPLSVMTEPLDRAYESFGCSKQRFHSGASRPELVYGNGVLSLIVNDGFALLRTDQVALEGASVLIGGFSIAGRVVPGPSGAVPALVAASATRETMLLPSRANRDVLEAFAPLPRDPWAVSQRLVAMVFPRGTLAA